MLASELIKELQSKIKTYGDLKVCDMDGYEITFADECKGIIKYAENGKYESYFQIS